VEFVTGVYLGLMFLSLYMFFFFVLLTIKNREEFFSYPKTKKQYSVSVVVPCYNEEASISGNILSLVNSDYPGLKKIVVVDDCSTDGSWKLIQKLAKKYPKVLAVQTPKNTGNAAGAKNYGAKFVDTELIGFSDADSHPTKEAIGRMMGYFDNPQMGAVTSLVVVRNCTVNLLSKLQAIEYMIFSWNRKITDFLNSVYVTTGPLSFYRSKLFFDIGGFDTKSMTEDIEITWNIISHDYKTAMCLDARITTEVPVKLKPWFRQRVRWGIGGLQAIAKYKEYFFKKGMFGYFVIPWVSLSIVLSIASFCFSWYLLFNTFAARFLTVGYSIVADTAIFQMQNLNFYPSVMIFFSLVLFTTSMTYYHYVLYRTHFEEKISIKRFFKLVFFALVFLTIYPIVWFAAIYRYIRKDFKW